jgi:hypothetical protein
VVPDVSPRPDWRATSSLEAFTERAQELAQKYGSHTSSRRLSYSTIAARWPSDGLAGVDLGAGGQCRGGDLVEQGLVVEVDGEDRADPGGVGQPVGRNLLDQGAERLPIFWP